MRIQEFYVIAASAIVLTVVLGFKFGLDSEWQKIPHVFFFSIIIILVSVFSKKLMAHMLDADVEHDIWRFRRYGFKPGWHFEKPVPAGIILPFFFALFSLGIIKLCAVITYETRATKARAARRFGHYSFTEMTDWHNGLIGASGIVSVLAVGFVAYFLPANLELLAALSTYYAVSNLIPFSNLDGAQIFYGSRLLWAVLASVAIIFLSFALLL